MLPERYQSVEFEELKQRIAKVKAKYGKKLVILGHHYQRDEIIEFADFTGDSYKLSKTASEQRDANYIVFCGVHFMAEAAQILAQKGQRVFLPHMEAGCPMADMASIEDVEYAWESIKNRWGSTKGIVPITYINSHATIKAFVARNGGLVCTSSNAEKAFDWAFKRGEKIFFFPDEHLGRNTSRKKGIPPEETAVWNPRAKDGGIDSDTFRRIRILLWKGYCHVHTLFTVDDVIDARKRYPEGKIIVHPECTEEVVLECNATGSTEGICRYAEDQPSGSTTIIGTEINLIGRLAKKHKDKIIVPLKKSLCPNMSKISPAHLLWTLENLGKVNEVIVPEPVRSEARLALERMLEV